jgi:hypothetical protein
MRINDAALVYRPPVVPAERQAMAGNQPDMHYWHFFLALETDLITASRYVEIGEENFETHSIEFARILLSACSEVETVTKLLCERISAEGSVRMGKQPRDAITQKFPKFPTMGVLVPRYELERRPWEWWGRDDTRNEIGKRRDRDSAWPPWWREYNEVKHVRHKHFRKANLRNTLDSLAGLLCLELYYYGGMPNDERCKVDPWPQLLTIQIPPPGAIGLEGHYGLPDDPDPGC